MPKKFNELVVLVRNGIQTPAIVVKSQLDGAGREILSVLFADPTTGPGLVLAGATRKVGSVELAVPPLTSNAIYGWLDLAIHPIQKRELAAHTDAAAAGEPAPALDFEAEDLPGVHGLPSLANESAASKAARLANLAHQEELAKTGAPPILRPSKASPTTGAEIQATSAAATGGGASPIGHTELTAQDEGIRSSADGPAGAESDQNATAPADHETPPSA